MASQYDELNNKPVRNCRMKARKTLRIIPIMFLLSVSFMISGCSSAISGFLAANAGSFALGYWFGTSANTVTTSECFVNGEPIDCSELP